MAYKQKINPRTGKFDIVGNPDGPGGSVQPDEEDITLNSENKLQFKNRTASETQMGYVILRADKTFAEQVTQANTIYEIRYGFDLGGATVEIPENCVLEFEGGVLENGEIKLNSTLINCNAVKCLDNVTLTGTLKNEYIVSTWFFSSESESITSEFNSFLDTAKVFGKGLLSENITLKTETPFLIPIGTTIDLGGKTITHSADSTDALFSMSKNSRITNGKIKAVYSSGSPCVFILGSESKSNYNRNNSTGCIIEHITIDHSNNSSINSSMSESIFIETSGFEGISINDITINGAKTGIKFHAENRASTQWLTNSVFSNIRIYYGEFGILFDVLSATDRQINALIFDNIRFVAFSYGDKSDYISGVRKSCAIYAQTNNSIFTNITHFNDLAISDFAPTFIDFDKESFANSVSNCYCEGNIINMCKYGTLNSIQRVNGCKYQAQREGDLDIKTNQIITSYMSFDVMKRLFDLLDSGISFYASDQIMFTGITVSKNLNPQFGTDEFGEYIEVSKSSVTIKTNGIKGTTLTSYKKICSRGFVRILSNGIPCDYKTTVSQITKAFSYSFIKYDTSEKSLSPKQKASTSYNETNGILSLYSYVDLENRTSEGEPYLVEDYNYGLISIVLSGIPSDVVIRVYQKSVVSSYQEFDDNAMDVFSPGESSITTRNEFSWANMPTPHPARLYFINTYWKEYLASFIESDSIFEGASNAEVKCYKTSQSNKYKIHPIPQEKKHILNVDILPSGMNGSYIAVKDNKLYKYETSIWSEFFPVTPILTTGKKIATINGVDIYAPDLDTISLDFVGKIKSVGTNRISLEALPGRGTIVGNGNITISNTGWNYAYSKTELFKCNTIQAISYETFYSDTKVEIPEGRMCWCFTHVKLNVADEETTKSNYVKFLRSITSVKAIFYNSVLGINQDILDYVIPIKYLSLGSYGEDTGYSLLFVTKDITDLGIVRSIENTDSFLHMEIEGLSIDKILNL